MGTCHRCAENLAHDEIALNLRLFGRGVGRICCLPCLAERLGCGEETLHQQIAHYKGLHCALFEPEFNRYGDAYE